MLIIFNNSVPSIPVFILWPGSDAMSLSREPKAAFGVESAGKN